MCQAGVCAMQLTQQCAQRRCGNSRVRRSTRSAPPTPLVRTEAAQRSTDAARAEGGDIR
jgi:hypothetical protein